MTFNVTVSGSQSRTTPVTPPAYPTASATPPAPAVTAEEETAMATFVAHVKTGLVALRAAGYTGTGTASYSTVSGTDKSVTL